MKIIELTWTAGNCADYGERLWELCNKSYLYGSPWSVEVFQQDLCQENSRYLIFSSGNCLDQEWLGFISYYQLFEVAEISHVVISKKYQGQGLGKQLLTYLIEQLKKAGAERALLEVRVSNRFAKKLYEAVGFQAIHTRKNYYHQPAEDGVLMEMRIKGWD